MTSAQKTWSPHSQLLVRNRGPGSIVATRAKRNPHPAQHVRTAKMQATPRPTAGKKEEAKKVKGQGDETPRKERRRQKQQQQWKRPAMLTKYLPLPARPTTLKSQMLSTFPNPDLAQVDITALTVVHSSITLQSITPPSQLPTVANSKRSEKATCGSSY